MDSKPLIAITLGDPAGIGPEIIVGAWTESVVHEWCRPLVVGHPGVLRRAVELWQTDLHVQEISSPEEAEPSQGVIPCLACGDDEVLDIKPGKLDARGGQAAYESVVAAARLALAGKVDAITTAPLQKEALRRAGHNFPGHTELLARLCGVDNYAMMLYLGPDEALQSPTGLAVVHVTLHTALRNVFHDLTEDAVLAKSRLADEFMARLTGRRPRIGICRLNPHAGEGGLFGDEELAVIAPAVQRGKALGLDLTGPLAADTLMVRARDGDFDAVVAMYHDQGHIALKLLGMHLAVNVTLGLPIIRTSVAHGTALDIAWKRLAETGSMIEALRVASQLAGAKQRPGKRSAQCEVLSTRLQTVLQPVVDRLLVGTEDLRVQSLGFRRLQRVSRFALAVQEAQDPGQMEVMFRISLVADRRIEVDQRLVVFLAGDEDHRTGVQHGRLRAADRHCTGHKVQGFVEVSAAAHQIDGQVVHGKVIPRVLGEDLAIALDRLVVLPPMFVDGGKGREQNGRVIGFLGLDEELLQSARTAPQTWRDWR